jgi:serine/threonine protein kinase
VIADFGISKKIATVSQVFSRTGGGGGAGTPGFMAPEQYDRQLYGLPGLPADVWAPGCVGVSMQATSGRPWPADLTALQIQTKIFSKHEVPEVPPGTQPELAAAIQRYLAHRPTRHLRMHRSIYRQ